MLGASWGTSQAAVSGGGRMLGEGPGWLLVGALGTLPRPPTYSNDVMISGHFYGNPRLSVPPCTYRAVRRSGTALPLIIRCCSVLAIRWHMPRAPFTFFRHLRSPVFAHPDAFDEEAMLVYAVQQERTDEIKNSPLSHAGHPPTTTHTHTPLGAGSSAPD